MALSFGQKKSLSAERLFFLHSFVRLSSRWDWGQIPNGVNSLRCKADFYNAITPHDRPPSYPKISVPFERWVTAILPFYVFFNSLDAPEKHLN
jgi:hypothetical protein